MRRPVDRGVADDQAVDTVLHGDIGDVVQLMLPRSGPTRRSGGWRVRSGAAWRRASSARTISLHLLARLRYAAQACSAGKIDDNVIRQSGDRFDTRRHWSAAASVLSRFFPGSPDDALAAVALAFRQAFGEAASPWLLKPKRLITASSSSSRNSLCRCCPAAASSVTVRLRQSEAERASLASGTSASLSKPAAS